MEPVKNFPVLFGQEGPLNGRKWVIKKELLIGRDSDCDISIPNRQVSRQHARIEITKNNLIRIIDLNSKNGTYVNDVHVSEHRNLEDGDVVKIALIQELAFISSDATLPLDAFRKQKETKSQKLFIDEKARRVWVGEEELLPPLSVFQYKLLTLLYKSENTVVSREKVIHDVWTEDEAIGVSEQALDALVRRLRARLNKIDPTHEYISTSRGVGFIFRNDTYKA